MNWLFKEQALLPQIIAVKYCKGANNTADDNISRHFSPSVVSNTRSSRIDQIHDEWPIGPEQWSEEALKPQRIPLIRPSVSTNSLSSRTTTNLELNAVTTRAQAKPLTLQIPSPTTNSLTSTIVQSSAFSSPSTNPLYDFSLSLICFEQEQDPFIQTKIQQVRNKQNHQG
ncbi:unnamed protein product [Rotaria sp. Silwood2]|nr:unnamed protein product [Rotaria sp. Silwood2]CAF3180883.1 unnamed protein product [Rotaria sp. Silwood2]CAF3469732.1 unnamed protein product [Rotaria sp. Silwood2]